MSQGVDDSYKVGEYVFFWAYAGARIHKGKITSTDTYNGNSFYWVRELSQGIIKPHRTRHCNMAPMPQEQVVIEKLKGELP